MMRDKLLDIINRGYFALIKTLDVILNWLASHYPTAYLFHNTILDQRYKAQRIFEDKLEDMVKKSNIPVSSSNNEVQSEVVVYLVRYTCKVTPAIYASFSSDLNSLIF